MSARRTKAPVRVRVSISLWVMGSCPAGEVDAGIAAGRGICDAPRAVLFLGANHTVPARQFAGLMMIIFSAASAAAMSKWS